MDNANKQAIWGPRIDLDGIENVYAPQTVTPFTPPPSGIDNLGIFSTDTFQVVGMGEAIVEFRGWVRVVRSKPTAAVWEDAEVYTNLIEMYMRGDSEMFGPVIVTLNPDVLSTGQIRTPFCDVGREKAAKACRMAVSAQFQLPKLGRRLFNREPIELTIDDVKSIPPAGNPGEGRIYQVLPLFDNAAPDARPAAYLTSLKFRMGGYLTRAEMDEVMQ
jgi:hypothetical protein